MYVFDIVSYNGESPLDYRAFVEPDREPKPTDSFKILKWKTGSRLASMFEKGQRFFGDELVELADLEDMDFC